MLKLIAAAAIITGIVFYIKAALDWIIIQEGATFYITMATLFFVLGWLVSLVILIM